MSGRSITIAALTWVVIAAACSEERQKNTPGPDDRGASVGLVIEAVNSPLRDFAERIGGDEVEVVMRVPEGVDPADWSPTVAEIESLQSADLVLLNGAGYSDWLDRVSLIPERLVDTSAEIRDRLIPVEGSLVHSHGPEGAHSHREVAFTIWLDPLLAVEQARAVSEALARTLPARADSFRERFDALEVELRGLDARIAGVAPAYREAGLLYSHPVYQYFDARYELGGASLHWEPTEIPGESHRRELAAILAKGPARWMIWEAQPTPEMRRFLEARGLASLVVDPAATNSESQSWLEVMQSNVIQLESAREASH